MVSTYTTNKVIEKPGSGDYANNWNVPVNADWDIIDQAFGGTTSLNATAGSATLTSTQYRSLFLGISGAISAAVTYTIPSGVGGQWVVYNSTTDSSGGPWDITIASAGGGTSVVVPRLSRVVLVSNGTNISILGYLTPNSSNTGFLTMSGAITAGTTISAGTSVSAGTSISATTTIAAGTTISAGTTSSDAIGNLREVPVNSQSGTYTLVASDSGKYISITSGSITVPNGVFSAGQTISIYNNSSSNLPINQGSGVVMTLASTTLTGNRTLANYGLSTILCTGSGYFVITGAGIS
jgi:hypothetical protein